MTVTLKELVKKYFFIYALLFLAIAFFSRVGFLTQISLAWIPFALLLNVGFSLSKVAALLFICRSVDTRLPFVAVFKAFLKSVTIGIVTFTGKAGFLASLFSHLSTQMDKKRAGWISGLFVAANFTSFAFFIPWLFPLTLSMQVLISLGCYLGVSLSVFFLTRKASLFGALFFMVLSYACNYAQVTLIAMFLHEPFTLGLFRTIVIADLARVISHVPFGIGILDGVYYLHFKNSAAFMSLPLFLILVRLSGELLTAFWGLCVFGMEALKGKHAA